MITVPDKLPFNSYNIGMLKMFYMICKTLDCDIFPAFYQKTSHRKHISYVFTNVTYKSNLQLIEIYRSR